MRIRVPRRSFAAVLLALSCGWGRTAPFDNPLRPQDLDPASMAVWGEDEARPVTELDRGRTSPSWIVWTQASRPGHSGFRFGAPWRNPGTRHFRMGFAREIPIGTVLLRASRDLRVSVLRPDAPYPGTLEDEAQWLPLESMQGNDLMWLLPPRVLTTRALRFSFDTTADDPGRQAHIQGLRVFPERILNLAPQATVLAGERPETAPRLTDGWHQGWWDPWSNLDVDDRGGTVVSESDPQWAMLVWPAPVELDGLATVWTGFREAEVQVFDGPDATHPREAPEGQWRSLGVHAFEHFYPCSLEINTVPFPTPVRTRAVRLRITQAIPVETAGAHLKDKPRDGRRVWLGELVAVRAIGDRSVDEFRLQGQEALSPPIPVRFRTDRAGFVTLVVDDAQGRRVRNVIAERYCEAGDHTVYWDGKDESIVRPGRIRSSSGRVMEGVHGINEVDGRLVPPGTYRVRGLVRDEVRMVYQTSVYNAGEPPWTTADGTGRWLADHSAPSDAVFVPGRDGRKPAMILAARVAEAGEGVIWTDLDGRKRRGIRWLGGHWTGAYFLARDDGPRADPDVQAYAGSTWSIGTRDAPKMDVRLSALRDQDTRAVLNHALDPGSHGTDLMRGLAVRDRIAYVSLAGLDEVLLVDADKGAVVGSAPLQAPGGLAFDAQGRLLALSGNRLLRFDLPRAASPLALPEPETVVADGLVAPVDLALDAAGNLYVSDQGDAHDVKVFDVGGRLLRRIGTAGGPRVGPYDETRMHRPAGLAVDGRGRLWVVEADLTPKRVSVWSPEGRFERAFYGPPQYGGGGTVDPRDRSRFYYARQGNASAMEFAIDWDTGDWRLAGILYRADKDSLPLPDFREDRRATGPQWPLCRNDRKYWTNAFNSNPTGGSGAVTVWQARKGVAVPVAVVCRAALWHLLREERFRGRWPAGADPADSKARNEVLAAWSDLDDDGDVQPDEVSMRRLGSGIGTLFVREDLAVTTSFTHRMPPRGFTQAGAPVYHVDDAALVVDPAPAFRFTSGGGEAVDDGEWVVLTGGPMRGYRNGELVWTYPSRWPGLHAGHSAPGTHEPGQLVATTRVVGQPFRPQGTDVRVWGINGDQGQVFLMTVDGLYVATLGGDARAPQWRMPGRTRGMRVDHVNLIGEHFWPTLIQPETGPAVLVAGKDHSSVVTVEGLESIRRIPEQTLEVTPALLAAASDHELRVAAARIAREGRDTLRVPLLSAPFALDAKPAKWTSAAWVRIDPDTEATLAVAGDRLVGAVRSRRYHNLLENTGESLPMLFKTGGALDLMVGTDPRADGDRPAPVPGDQRLVMTRVGTKTKAALYAPVVPGTPKEQAHPFSSPWRTLNIDRVADVSDQVELAQGFEQRDGTRYTLYEWSVPLRVLGWTPAIGQRLRGDVGVLVGRDGVTTQRLYWQNQATSIVEDVPSEAALTPALWGFLDVVGND